MNKYFFLLVAIGFLLAGSLNSERILLAVDVPGDPHLSTNLPAS